MIELIRRDGSDCTRGGRDLIQIGGAQGELRRRSHLDDEAERERDDRDKHCVVVRDARAAPLVRHDAADGADERADERSEEGRREAGDGPAGVVAVALLTYAAVEGH